MTDEAPPNAPSAEAASGDAQAPAPETDAAKLDAVPAAEKVPEVVQAPAADKLAGEGKPAEEGKPPGDDGALPQTPGVPAGPAWRPDHVVPAIVSVVSLGLDLGTKWWAEARLHTVRAWPETRVDVIKDHVGFMFRKNDGGAWGP